MEVENFFGAGYRGNRNTGSKKNTTANAPGFGKLYDDEAEHYIDLNQQFIHNRNATLLMQVTANSMKDAGICRGDIVIIDKSIKPGNGKIVVAIMEGEMLLRRYQKTFNGLTLLADNAKMNAVVVNECSDFVVWGVVVYVIKTL